MNFPFISAVCLCYGGTARVHEALACFLNQTYGGQRELILFNSCSKQKYVGDFPNVRIINLDKRPPSLSVCRNMAIEAAKGTIITTWDSDDLWLPHHLTAIGEAFAEHPDVDWVRLNPVFYADNWKILKTFSSWINAISFTKAAWEKAGKYPTNLSVGEDQAIWSKLNQMRGITVELKPEEVSAIYCWNTGTFHISGLGWDQPNRPTAYQRAFMELERRFRRGQEPVGEIKLKPVYLHNPVSMANAFLHRPRPIVKKNSVCLIELGRYGDIVNILPIARHIAETYDVPHLMVSKEFADLLESVSYVHPCVVDLRNDQLNEAVAIAHKQFKHVINCQIWGTNWPQEKQTASFNRESWRVAGFNFRFDDHSPKWLPSFDRRNGQREALVIQKCNDVGLPLLLVNVTHSRSSPFQGEPLLKAIRERFSSRYSVVDCGSMRLERVYDVLGLMDNAKAMVSIDTALLHFGAATGIPTVAIVNDKPWQGTEPRGNCPVRIGYAIAQMDPGVVLEAVEQALRMDRISIPSLPALQPAPNRIIFHVAERHHERRQLDLQRKRLAWNSWDVLYDRGDVVPCHTWEPYRRSAKTTIGDPRDLPYLKDVIEAGMNQAGDDDIIMWCNDDNVLHPDLPDVVRLHCSLWELVSSQRCEFKTKIPPLTQSPMTIAALGGAHMGRDIFAWTKRRLVQDWDTIPDFILGASDFDLALACMMRLQWGIKTDRPNVEKTLWPAELKRGYVLHKFHMPLWCARTNVESAPSQKHNRRLFREWAKKFLPSLCFHPNNTI